MGSTVVEPVRYGSDPTVERPVKSGGANGSASRAQPTVCRGSTFAAVSSTATRGHSTGRNQPNSLEAWRTPCSPVRSGADQSTAQCADAAVGRLPFRTSKMLQRKIDVSESRPNDSARLAPAMEAQELGGNLSWMARRSRGSTLLVRVENVVLCLHGHVAHVSAIRGAGVGHEIV